MLKTIHSLLFLLFFSSTLFGFTTAPNVNDDSHNFLGPFWQGQATFLFSEDMASSTLVEAGARNFRINETLGFVDSCQKNWFKLGAEYLKQDIDYTFYSGVQRKWVHQYAVGAVYQYFPEMDLFSHFDLGGFYSHAPSYELSKLNGDFIENGDVLLYTNFRRIAGSNAAGINGGATFYLWQGAEAGLAVYYDNVNYDLRYERDNSVKGIGASVAFTQYLSDSFKIDALAEGRAPFDAYNLGISWLIPSCYGEFALGVAGGYVNGKHCLPNTRTLAITLSFVNSKSVAPPCPPTIGQWTAKPAVYMPQVLAIKDENVEFRSVPCIPPAFIGPDIASQLNLSPGTPITPINAAALFTGSNLTYSLIGIPPAWGTVTIDPVTGIISGNSSLSFGSSVNLQVQATNSCGTVTSNVFQLSVVNDD